MAVLVTGANGHVGANLVRLLVAEGRAVRAFVRPSSDLRSLQGVSCERVVGDVLDPTSVTRAAKGCQTVFHLAAMNRLWGGDADAIFRTAVDGTQNVLRAAVEAGVERVVYTSTLATVGRTSTPDQPVTESKFAPPSAIPYGRGKAVAEAWVREFHQATGLPVVIVNPTAILGPYDYRITPVSGLVAGYLRGRPALAPPGGLNVVDVRDVAQGHLLAERRGRAGERYLLGGTNVTYAEFFRRLSVAAGRRTAFLQVPRWAAWTGAAAAELIWRLAGPPPPITRAMVQEIFGRYSFCDTTKAHVELGYRARPLEETLNDTVAWFRALRLASGKAVEFDTTTR